MTGAHRTADARQVEVGDVLAAGRRRAAGTDQRPAVGPRAVLALQRQAGNAAVGALLAARARLPGEQAVADIDAALAETRRDRPAINTVEKGLRAAQAAGIPVELEGPKPPASALAVIRTGFGPEAVPPKKPVPPPKPVPAVSPLGKAAAKKARPPGRGGAGRAGAAPAAAPAPARDAAAGPGPAVLPADKLLQPPVAPTPVRPEQDPAFAHVVRGVQAVAATKKAHPPARAKAEEAQDAAVAPADDLGAQAKAAKVDTMDAQPPGTFDKKAFIAAVKAAIEAKSPKTLEEADEYTESGRAGEVKGDVKGLVSQGKEGQAKDIEAATEAPPDPSKAVPKPVTPMAPETPGRTVPVPAGGAVPKPAPPEQTNLAAGKHEADRELADAGVTETQMAQSGEREFHQALTAKKAAAEHADTAPAAYRAQEQQVLDRNRAEAAAVTTAGTTGMQGAKGAAVARLVAAKGKTKSKDEARRREVTARVQAVFAATEIDVQKILDGIDPKVDAAFEQGEAKARAVFENYVDAKMSAYKKDRYSGWLGGYRWVRDKIRGMPAKVNEFYAAGRELYLQRMDGVISGVAKIVGDDLTKAKQRIAKGRAEIAAYVGGLPADLKKVGAEASAEIGDRFDQLEADVDAKQDAVVDALATKYVASRKELDGRIEELQAANRGLVDKAVGAIKAVINTIRELAAMLRNVLSRVAGVVGDIVKNPVGFLGNLIAGVKGGILRFKDNVLDHLRKGLMGWLFGALAEGGVELPDTFDLKGVVKLLASLFGLTWAGIRARIAKQIGEPAMAAVEKGVEIFQLLATQGVAGLWQLLVEKIGNLKDMILEKVQDFVVTRVITAGITWLIGLLNPAAAFVKACKLIYDVVMFFVNNAARIAKFVDTVIDSVADIVRGNVGAVVTKIENVLGQMVPLLIGFLASVIGLGGIGQKVRETVKMLQKPVKRAVDAVVRTGLRLAAPIIRGLKGVGGKVRTKVAAGKAWVKGKAEAGKAWVRTRTGKDRGQLPGQEPAPGSRGVDVSKPFDMSGTGHTLFAKTVRGRLNVEMASRRQDLASLLSYAEGEAAELERSNTPKKGLRKALNKVYVPLGRAEALHDSTYQGTRMTAALEKRINELVVDAAALLGDVGRTFGLKSLRQVGHPSEWVTAEGELKNAYRGKSFRPKVYGSWDKDHRTNGSHRNAEFDRLRALVPAASPDRKHPDAYHCPECGRVRLDVARQPGELTFDHNPSVASHWKSTGNNCSHDERNEWFNGRGSNGAALDPMCRSCNSSKGSGLDEPTSYKVGRGFRGRNEGKAS